MREALVLRRGCGRWAGGPCAEAGEDARVTEGGGHTHGGAGCGRLAMGYHLEAPAGAFGGWEAGGPGRRWVLSLEG